MPRPPFLVLLVACTLAVCARPSSAQEVVGPTNLSWSNCFGKPGYVGSIAFDCDPMAGAVYQLIGSFNISSAITRTSSLDVGLDIMFPGAGSVPPFWEFGPGGCNPMGFMQSKSNPPDCGAINPYCNGDTLGCDIIYSATSIRGPNTMHIMLTVARSTSSTVALAALPTEYVGFVLNVPTGPAGTCTGCGAPAAMVWNTGVINQLDSGGSELPPALVESTYPAASPCAGLNGGDSACATTPTRPMTWGRLKTLYR
jgi:hypothetical protein